MILFNLSCRTAPNLLSVCLKLGEYLLVSGIIAATFIMMIV